MPWPGATEVEELMDCRVVAYPTGWVSILATWVSSSEAQAIIRIFQLQICKHSCCLVQFSLVAQSCQTLCDPMDCSMPGFPVRHQLLEPTQTHVHRVGDTTQPSHHLLSPSPPAFNLSQHQGLLKWVSSSYQVVKVLEFQLQHKSLQWIFRIDFL